MASPSQSSSRLGRAWQFVLEISQAAVAIRYGAPWAKSASTADEKAGRVRAYSA